MTARTLSVVVVALGLAGSAPGTAGHPRLPSIALPAGFRLQLFAGGLGAPRFMVQDDAGTVLVSVPREGRILALPDRDRDGAADAVVPVLTGLDLPYGLALAGRDLYVAETGRVSRWRYDGARLTARDPVAVVPDLPAGAHHWSRTIVLGPDGALFISVGSSCDVCREADPRRSTVLRHHANGGVRVFATGLRSVVGLAFQHSTGALWATVNERDWTGGGAPPDYITGVRAGAHYGWPDCFAAGRAFAPDPEFRGTGACGGMTLPTLEIPPHSAPLGLAFHDGTQFPREYRGSLFVAYHGSRPGLAPWVGYKIVRVRFDGEAPRVEDFATGWRHDDRVEGRPADLLVGRDGTLFVSDDHAGRIYRIVYGP